MKKRKRAGAERRRDPSSPASDTAPVSEEKAEAAAANEAAAVDEAAAPPEAAPAVAGASEDQGEGAPVAVADAEAGAANEAQAADAPAIDGDPADEGGVAATAAATSAAPLDEDDAGWEDAPTRELELGNMEFAATWSDGPDTLPNVEPEPEAVESAPGAEAIEEGEALPSDSSRVESILESLLFATDRPLGVSDLKRLLAVKDSKIVTDALGALRDRRADSGIQLISVAGGWQLRTHPANGAWVAKLVAGRPQRLSRAMMETLAIVAYRQPITRPEIDEIRGVDCGPVLRTLLDRNLIRIIGKKEEVGRPMLYGTTPEFLKTFSLRDLTELPTLREFHELGADEKAQVEAKMPAPSGSDAAGTSEQPLRPTMAELPQADPAEEDALFDELDRASEAAARATAAGAEAPAADPAAESGSPGGGAGMGEP